MNGVNAIEALESGHFPVFYPENNGREGLFINIQALFIGALSSINPAGFHVEPWMLRFPSAVFGTLTVLGLFFLTRVLTQNDFAAGAAMLFAATSFWHINFSRIGLRAITSPFWIVWALYFLLWGFAELERRSRLSAWLSLALAGICYGLGFHSYIAYRATPVVILAVLLWLSRSFASSGRIRLWAAGAGLFVGMAAIAAFPLILFFLRNPAAFTGRAGQVSVLSSPSALRHLLSNLGKTLAMFNISGDQLARHNVPGRPELFLPVGLLFVTGIAIGIWNIFQRRAAPWPFVLCLGWIAIGLAPAVLSNEGQPHALRSILAIPPCMILAALGADRLRLWIAGRYPPHVLWSAGSIVAIGLVLEAYLTYFVTFARDPRTRDAFDSDLADLGREVAALPVSVPKFIVMVGAQPDQRGTPSRFYAVALLSGGYNPAEQQLRNIHFVFTREEAERVVKLPGVQAWVVQ
jgi:hypothetical protein